MLPSAHEMLIDMANAMSTHEKIRGEHGPGLGHQNDSRYTLAHQIMSKLSVILGTDLSLDELEDLAAKYKDCPEHEGFVNVPVMPSLGQLAPLNLPPGMVC